MRASSGGAHHPDTELLRERLRLMIQIIENLQMVRNESERNYHYVFDSFAVKLAQVIENVGFEPGLRRWAAAALIHQVPSGESSTFRHQARGFAQLLFVVTGLRHGTGNAVRGGDEAYARKIFIRESG
jgi:hypothetical protein